VGSEIGGNRYSEGDAWTRCSEGGVWSERGGDRFCEGVMHGVKEERR